MSNKNMENMEKTPDELREMAQEQDRRRTESFDRCDTDGFVTQFCQSLNSDLSNAP